MIINSMSKFDEVIRTIIQEGLTKSYDGNKFEQAVMKLNNKHGTFMVGSEPYAEQGGDQFIFHLVMPSDIDAWKKDMSRISQLYGWDILQMSTSDLNGNEVMDVMAEKAFPDDKIMYDSNYHVLYHFTNKKGWARIQKQGLLPSDTDTTFNHRGDRTYLFMVSVEVDDDFEETILPILESILSDKRKNDPDNWDDDDLMMLHINYPKAKESFDIDPSLSDFDENIWAVLNRRAIAPKYIKGYKTYV